MIKYVFIDIDDTIIDFHKSAEVSIKNMLKEQNLPCPDNVMIKYRKVCDPLWHKVEKREITLKQLQEIRWQMVFRELGVDYNPEIDYEQKYRENLAKTVFEIEGSRQLLEYLSKKYTVCAASNSYYFQQIKRLKLAGFDKYITHLFTSNEIGAEKPYKDFFEGCFEKLSNPPKNEVIMIGDSLTADIDGAFEYGIKSIWFNKNKIDAQNVKADYTVLKLVDIMEKL